MIARLLFALALVLATQPAMADNSTVWEEEEPPPLYVPELRRAPHAVIGFDFGVGGFDGLCDQCRFAGGISLDLFGGLQVHPRIALVADAWSVLHVLATDGSNTGLAQQSIGVAAVRVWLIPTLWLQSGGGIGLLSSFGRDDVAVFGPAAMLAVGGELDHAPTRGIDLQLRAGGLLLDDLGGKALFYSFAAVAGFHWN